MEQQFKYIYAGKEVSKEEFTNITKELFKWFDNNTINAVDYSSVSDFLGENYKSKGEINKHLKGVLENFYTGSNLFRIQDLQRCKFDNLVDKKEFYITPPTKENLEKMSDSFLHRVKNNSDKCGILAKKETETTYKETGEKHNKHKLPMSKLFLQFPDALQAVVLASCYGHHCYPSDTDWLNFKRVEGGSQNYKDAEIRHFLGGEKDKESNLPEIFHQAWNKLAELQLWLEENRVNIKDFSKNYLENLQNQK